MLKPGFNLINPCTEEISLVDMKVITISAGKSEVITKDNVSVCIQTSFAYRITNPIIAYSVLGNQLNTALIELTFSSLRNVVGVHNLDQVLRERSKIVEEAI